METPMIGVFCGGGFVPVLHLLLKPGWILMYLIIGGRRQPIFSYKFFPTRCRLCPDADQ
jgi:hypothetical protein